MCLWHHTVGLGHLAQLWHSCGSVGQTSIRTVNIYYAARILNTVYISAPNTVNTQAHVSAGRQCILTYSTNTKFLAGYHWLCTNAVSRWIQFQNLAGGPPAYSFLETMSCFVFSNKQTSSFSSNGRSFFQYCYDYLSHGGSFQPFLKVLIVAQSPSGFEKRPAETRIVGRL